MSYDDIYRCVCWIGEFSITHKRIMNEFLSSPAPISERELVGRVYQDDPHGGPDCACTLRVHMFNLRQRLKGSPWTIYRTRARGYWLDRA